MKKLILGLLILMFSAQIVSAQATNFQRRYWWSQTGTTEGVVFDSTFADSITVEFPENRGKGLIRGWVWFDSLRTKTIIDSFNFRYREAWNIPDGSIGSVGAWAEAAAQNSSGEPQAWTFVKIDNGMSGSLTAFDSTLTFIPNNRATNPGGKIPIVISTGGYPWRGFQLMYSHTGGDDLTSNFSDDSIRVYIEFDND